MRTSTRPSQVKSGQVKWGEDQVKPPKELRRPFDGLGETLTTGLWSIECAATQSYVLHVPASYYILHAVY